MSVRVGVHGCKVKLRLASTKDIVFCFFTFSLSIIFTFQPNFRLLPDIVLIRKQYFFYYHFHLFSLNLSSLIGFF